MLVIPGCEGKGSPKALSLFGLLISNIREMFPAD
jgi:hypothetical protein